MAGPPLHHPASVCAGDVAPDGQRIATQAKAGIYLWDRATGDPLSRLALSDGMFPKTGEVRPLFSADGRRLTLTDGTTAVTAELMLLRAPLDTLAPLAELPTSQRLHEVGGAEFLDQGAILADPARYRRASLARRGLVDDLAAQPARLQGP
jgi:hypothetical protein